MKKTQNFQRFRFAWLGAGLFLVGFCVSASLLRFSTRAQAQPADPIAPKTPDLQVHPAQPVQFAHPGVLSSQSQLDFMRQQVIAGREPWKSAYAKMLTAKGASLDYSPTPSVIVRTNDPSDDEFRNDAQAAYAHALQWVITGNVAHKNKSIEIMNAWSAQFQNLVSSPDDFVWQYQLHTAQVVPMWVSAAEIVRYHRQGAAGWPAAEVTRFEGMLNILHGIITSRKEGCAKGWASPGCAYTDSPEFKTLDQGRQANWETSSALAITSIGVFENDRAKYEDGKARWQIAMPRGVYPTGQTGEACRDCAHAEMGIVPLMATAEIAWHQGDDLYSVLNNRLSLGMEFTSARATGSSIAGTCNGKAVTFASCFPKTNKTSTRVPGWEIGLNHYQNRKALVLPFTRKYVLEIMRPEPQRWNFVGWTTLTHAENPGKTPAKLAAVSGDANTATTGNRLMIRLQTGSKPAASDGSCGSITSIEKPPGKPKQAGVTKKRAL